MLIGLDVPSCKSYQIEVGFKLFFIIFKLDYSLFDLNWIILPQTGSNLYRIWIGLPTLFLVHFLGFF